jgi:hypothetical protein
LRGGNALDHGVTKWLRSNFPGSTAERVAGTDDYIITNESGAKVLGTMKLDGGLDGIENYGDTAEPVGGLEVIRPTPQPQIEDDGMTQ